jgi:pimeloyl-ACP methyl ester carboxylesterase
VVVLHGLLGSSRNWRSVIAELSRNHRVCALDLRNHGASPHSGPFTMDDMTADVEAWLEAHPAAAPATLIGHSLGGKTAMKLACRRPDLVRALIIVDISSKATPRRWVHVFKAMQGIDLSALRDRKDAEHRLEADGVQDWAFRKFLSSNLETDEQGRWRWKIGLDALSASCEGLVAEVLTPEQHFDGPTLLIRGAKSDFAPDADIPAMRQHFPTLRVETIPNAAHNIHIEAQRSFLDIVRAFLAA